jgi:hypothetical protein
MLHYTPMEKDYLLDLVVRKGTCGMSRDEYLKVIKDLLCISGTSWKITQLQGMMSKLRKELGVKVDLSTCGALRGRIPPGVNFAVGNTSKTKANKGSSETFSPVPGVSERKRPSQRFNELFDQIDAENRKEIDELKYQLEKRNFLCLQSKEIREIAIKIAESHKTEDQFALISDLISACKSYKRKYEER